MSNNMYAVVCSGNTALLWPKAVAKLKDKYEAQWPGRVHVVTYEHSSITSGSTEGSFTSALGVLSSLAQLSQLRPHFSCFLTHFSECSKVFVQDVNRLTRELDPSHPYSDTIWGILTGFCEDDVLAALDLKYLTVRRVIGNCPVDLEKFKTGIWFSEFDRGVSYRKLSDLEQFGKEPCPDDTTELIAQEIGSERLFCDKNHPVEKGVDMIISSGHASERDWHITYSFEGGTFHSIEGQLSGSTVVGGHVDICWSKNPKILCAAGNCLMAHIVDRDCMALGWMHSANVVQMVGYVEPTWFGYGGWGVNKYFINNPGVKSLAESFFANQQSLLHRLHTRFEENLGMRVMDHCAVYGECFNTSASGLARVPRECSGLMYDRDIVVLYGDPAWRAELETNPEVDHYRCTLEEVPSLPVHTSEDWTTWKFTLSVLRSGQWDCPTPDDKETCPGRPPVYVFPQRMCSPVVLEGTAVVMERFLLLPLCGPCSPGQQYIVLFKTRPI